MTTFSKKTFDAVAYAATRPMYPPTFYNRVMIHANKEPRPLVTADLPRTLLDLGCGPGLSTFPLVPWFERVIAVDPSEGMIAAAKDIQVGLRESGEIRPTKPVVEFIVGRADNLDQVADASVDFVIAAQAVHWFPMPETYRELRRVLKPGGTFAFWGYGEFFFPTSKDLSSMVPKFSGGVLGPYWQQPGRSIVEQLLDPIPFPNNDPNSVETSDSIHQYGEWDTSSFHRVRFSRWGEPQPSPVPIPLPGESQDKIMLRHKWDPISIEAYLRTWSAHHSYMETGAEDQITPFIIAMKKLLMTKKLKRQDKRIWLSWKMGMLTGRKAMI